MFFDEFEFLILLFFGLNSLYFTFFSWTKKLSLLGVLGEDNLEVLSATLTLIERLSIQELRANDVAT